jgi:hypothetical protein
MSDKELMSFRTATEPQAFPWVVAIGLPICLKVEKEYPMPPPNFCIIADTVAACMILSILSSRGMTKHADSVPWPVPALNKVGEFGINTHDAISS